MAVERDGGAFEYHLTQAGRDLRPRGPRVSASWGQRWVESEPSLQNLDVSLLMWDMRRNLDTTPMPKRRSVIQFRYPELPAAKRSYYWLVVEASGPGQEVDLCSVDMGFDVDLYVTSDLHAP